MLISIMSVELPTEQKETFEQVYNKYKHLMKATALSVLKNDELAEDAVHDAFMILIENMHCVDAVNTERTKAFALIITKNIALNRYTKERRHITVDDKAFFSLASNHDPFQAAYVNDIIEKVHRLPDIYRDTLELVAYYGMSSRQAARVLGVSATTVRKRISRIRQFLDSETEDYK